jgi:hypothetical protein
VARATVQLGNARFPFETPEFAFELLTEGDTIRIHPGAVDWHSNGGNMTVGAVILGDTLTDGTRPILRGQVGETNNGFSWRGGRHGTVANLVLKEFGAGIRNRGLANLIVRNVRIETQEGDGLLSLEAMDTLQVFNSVFSGDSSSSTGSGIIVNGALRVALNKVQATGWDDDGVLLNAADTLDMFQSNLSGNGGIGLHMIDPTGKGLVTVSHSRFVNNGWEGVFGHGDQISIAFARTVLFDHNYIQSLHDLAVYLEHPDIIAGSTFRSMKDSIRDRALTFAENKDWLFTNLDSLFADSLWVQFPQDTALNGSAQINSRFAQIKNSQFLNLARGAFRFGGNRLVVDSSTFTSCGVPCNWTTFDNVGIYLVERLFGTGLGEGPNGVAKGSALVTNNSFFALEAALETGTTSFVGPIVFSHNVVDSVSSGMDVDADSASASDNVFSRVFSLGVHLRSGPNHGPASVLRNTVTCTSDLESFGIGVEGHTTVIEENGVRQCGFGIAVGNTNNLFPRNVRVAFDTVFSVANAAGIQVDGYISPTLLGNRVVGGGVGLSVQAADTGTVVIDSNSVSATTQAAVSLVDVQGQITGRKNNIANNLLDGISVYCSGTHVPKFNFGRLIGNAGFAVVTQECPDSVDATNNWWGDASPGDRPISTPNGRSSARIGTDPVLPSDPSNVPPLAPRFFPSTSAAQSAPASAPVRSRVKASHPSAHHPASPRRDADLLAQQAGDRAARLARDAAVIQALKARAASLPPPRR